jgi:hypothetical protein
MLHRYGVLVLGRASAKSALGTPRRHFATAKKSPSFASTGRKPSGKDSAPEPFADDPNLQTLLKYQQWEDEEGPDPTPEELEEENRMAEQEPMTEEDRKLVEDLEKASAENLLEFIDMDQIMEHTGQGDMYTKPIAKYEGKLVDKRGEMKIEVTRSGAAANFFGPSTFSPSVPGAQWLI